MKLNNFLFLLLALLFASCAFKPAVRTPSSEENFLSAHLSTSDFALKDIAQVNDPKHATHFYSHENKTEKTILIMHGLHESPDFMKGFSDYFFQKGYTVISLRLPGHQSKNPDDINHVKANEWIRAAEGAFAKAHQLSDHVEILGYSTGGTLGIYLSLKYPNQVKRLHLISPAIALSDRVFLSSVTMGWTNIDLSKICKKEKESKWLCKAVLFTDEQLKLMLNEKIVSSPSAGLQVQMLINIILEQFSPSRSRTTSDSEPSDYYSNLREMFHQLQVPMVMVNSDYDNVVQPRFNHSLMRDYKGNHKEILFNKNLKISHIMINKSKIDAFKSSEGVYNPQFDKMIELIEGF